MLEEIIIQGQGFRPLKDHGSWRIAQLSFDPTVNALDSLGLKKKHARDSAVVGRAGAKEDGGKAPVGKREMKN